MRKPKGEPKASTFYFRCPRSALGAPEAPLQQRRAALSAAPPPGVSPTHAQVAASSTPGPTQVTGDPLRGSGRNRPGDHSRPEERATVTWPGGTFPTANHARGTSLCHPCRERRLHGHPALRGAHCHPCRERRPHCHHVLRGAHCHFRPSRSPLPLWPGRASTVIPTRRGVPLVTLAKRDAHRHPLPEGHPMSPLLSGAPTVTLPGEGTVTPALRGVHCHPAGRGHPLPSPL